MNLIVASVALVAGIVVWWLAARRLTTRPWEAQGTFDGRDAAQHAGPRSGANRLVGVPGGGDFVLRAVHLGLLHSHEPAAGSRALVLRDWRPVAEPSILWLNTAALLASSIGMQLARAAVGRGDVVRARAGMFAGGVFALAFLAGQLLAWRQLQAAGYYAAGNPANAFFYVLTGPARPAPARRTRRLGPDGVQVAAPGRGARCDAPRPSSCAPCTGTTCWSSGWSCSACC